MTWNVFIIIVKLNLGSIFNVSYLRKNLKSDIKQRFKYVSA